MAEESTEPATASTIADIPKDFPLRELLQEVTSTWKTRKEYIEGRRQASKPIAPSYELAMYSMARLEATGRLIRRLMDEEKAALDSRKRAEEGDDGF